MFHNNKNKIEENTYTYEEYISAIEKIQNMELESKRFKEISEFIEKYKIRNSHIKEKILFNMLNNVDNYDNQMCLEKIKKIKEIINNLTDTELELNIYLKAIKQGYIISKNDCEKIVEKTIKIYEDLPTSSEYQYMMVDLKINKKVLNSLGEYVNTTAYVKHYPETEEDNYDTVFVLDEENIKYYELYNEIIKSIHEIYKSIYYYNLIKELSNADMDISEICFEFDTENLKNVSTFFLVKKENKKNKHKKK